MLDASLTEFLLLCMIGLIVLGPKRLPQVASQIGTWVGQARRMTRQLKRQLEEEVDLEKNLGIDPKSMHIPLDDDTYSPVHDADAATDPEESEAQANDAPATGTEENEAEANDTPATTPEESEAETSDAPATAETDDRKTG